MTASGTSIPFEGTHDRIFTSPRPPPSKAPGAPCTVTGPDRTFIAWDKPFLLLVHWHGLFFAWQNPRLYTTVFLDSDLSQI